MDWSGGKDDHKEKGHSDVLDEPNGQKSDSPVDVKPAEELPE
jgi:hypothetical protein